MKTFLIEDFFHLPPVPMTQVVHLELRVRRSFSLKAKISENKTIFFSL
jgi:hypothetical protein